MKPRGFVVHKGAYKSARTAERLTWFQSSFVVLMFSDNVRHKVNPATQFLRRTTLQVQVDRVLLNRFYLKNLQMLYSVLTEKDVNRIRKKGSSYGSFIRCRIDAPKILKHEVVQIQVWKLHMIVSADGTWVIIKLWRCIEAAKICS